MFFVVGFCSSFGQDSAQLDETGGPTVPVFEKNVEKNSIDAKKLYLYQKLEDITTILSTHQLLGKANKQALPAKIFQEPLKLVRNTKDLLERIVVSFNAENLFYNPEIGYRFVNNCNFLRDINEVCPHHIREYKKQLAKFDAYLQNYKLTRKDFLQSQDIELIDNIRLFNHHISCYMLRDEFFDICFADKVIDSVWYRPLEWIDRHPLLTTGIIITAACFVGYFYVYPKYLEWYYRNCNKDFDGKQLLGSGQNAGECALIALAHALIAASSDDEQTVQNRLNILKDNQDILDGWRQFITTRRAPMLAQIPVLQGQLAALQTAGAGHEQEIVKITQDIASRSAVQGSSWLHGNEVQDLLQPAHITPFLSRLGIGENPVNIIQRVVVVESGRTLPGNSAEFARSIQAFRANSHPQVVVLNTGGHWIALKLMPNTQARNNVFFWVIDSMPFNDTASSYVTNVLNTYTRLPLMRPGMQAILPMVQTAENVFAVNNDTAGALHHLRNAVMGSIVGDGRAFIGDPAFAVTQQQMAQCFDAIRNQNLFLGQHGATIGASARMVDFDTCLTFNDFIRIATT